MAVGHTMLVMMYHMLRDGVAYKELGPDYLDKLQPLDHVPGQAAGVSRP